MEEDVPEAEKLMCPKEVVEKNKDKQEEEEDEKGAKGGILNNLISNFMDCTTTTVEGKSSENIQKSLCEDEDEKEQESPSVGILEKIISHLPEDVAPTTDEAAILIHSAID
ncbi:hypothetical protein [Arabidopsis thaliana]|uniref:Uncharacterized protein At3g51750 n=4 Tax=Arabidopsis TaxID=3701 RepID=Q9SCT3_ARATH|nr:uncharacterized protein AT3G51750 [Arabidopsis thaliana]NP_190743.1 uncharacterized protein AT3G51750 [Arabidopsis thaliana]KAG7628153.1 hypothetical protein ISN45_At03g044390 [Arabidopsis thaliana x Arabidopsis arenosa]KAG7634065.1 hypothetical protein ISN44_As03g043330 [Arabidopsis suecica]AAL38820.1 unknown protein [Arabidopsis thaliana]AAM51241.1 unknown protein [Arabidopsis thaliana]AEE78833.1 hypothetical protein AT3G51750 [Arabidopsis thaliana]|eukprot:NP_001190057.1 hypothetical protein AT3G51750 [Arabidopsis thaliana]